MFVYPWFQESVNSYSTVELSPNPPSESTVEDQSFRTTKDDLLQQISKVRKNETKVRKVNWIKSPELVAILLMCNP
jgi:hypothetical protein